MSRLLLIAGRELGAYRRSWIGPVILASALLADGLFFYIFALREAMLSARALATFFYYAGGIGAFAAIMLSMRLIAEERQTGTITLLNTAPVREVEIVAGKYLAVIGVLAVLTALTCYMPLWLMVRGKISLGHVLVGYLGVLLFDSAVAAIGLFASTLTRSQLVAAAVAAIVSITLLLMWFVARAVDPPLNAYFDSLALHHKNFIPFQDGILQLHNVVYYLVVIYFFLLAATKSLEARRWR